MRNPKRRRPEEAPGGALELREQTVVDVNAAPAEAPSRGALQFYWDVARRQKWVLAISVVVCVAAAVTMSLLQPPRYQARASVEVLAFNDDMVSAGVVDPSASSAISADVQLYTQVEIFRSDAVLSRVVERLGLADQPGFAPDVEDPKERHRRVRAGLGRHLKVNPIRGTRLIELQFDAEDPQLAAEILNALIEESVNHQLLMRRHGSEYVRGWLTEEVEKLKKALHDAEARLHEHARRTGFLVGSEVQLTQTKLLDLQRQLSQATAERRRLQTRYAAAVSGPIEALAEAQEDRQLQDYKGRAGVLREKIANLQAMFTQDHPELKRAQAELREVNTLIEQEWARILMGIKSEFEAAKRHEELLSEEYVAQTRKMSSEAADAVKFEILQRDVEAQGELYKATAKKVKELALVAAPLVSEIRQVDMAEAPSAPYEPNLPMNTAFGLFAGLLLGFGVGVVRDRSDDSVRMPGELPEYADVPELGVIPETPGILKAVSQVRGTLVTADGKAPASPTVTGCNAWQQADPRLAESFRCARTTLMFTKREGKPPQLIVITSPSSGEGKTSVAVNLGIGLAEARQRVLLVDADLRRPNLHSFFLLGNGFFEAERTAGLSNLLRAGPTTPLLWESVQAAIQETEVANLYVLTAGNERANISELLHSPNTPVLLTMMRRHFDVILIDTPPVIEVFDARVLGKLADGVIIVLASRQTPRTDAVTARRLFAADGTPVLGTLLNRAKAEGGRYGGRYRYYYRHTATSGRGS